MHSRLTSTPREFGAAGRTIRDFGAVVLEPGEMIAVTQGRDQDCDVTATSFGFYLGASDQRMRGNGFRVAVVENLQGKQFVMAVLEDRENAFLAYLREDGSRVVAWLGRVKGGDTEAGA